MSTILMRPVLDGLDLSGIMGAENDLNRTSVWIWTYVLVEDAALVQFIPSLNRWRYVQPDGTEHTTLSKRSAADLILADLERRYFPAEVANAIKRETDRASMLKRRFDQ